MTLDIGLTREAISVASRYSDGFAQTSHPTRSAQRSRLRGHHCRASPSRHLAEPAVGATPLRTGFRITAAMTAQIKEQATTSAVFRP